MGFETVSGAEIVSRIRRSILILQGLLGGLGTIAIAVATLGIANTLLTAVYERMREIGVMKAVGARRKDIRRQFFAEAGLIGLIGGLAGLIVGFTADHLLTLVIGRIVRAQGGQDPGALAVHTPTIALGCLGFSIVLSLLAGTFPAARAARLDPMETLRHE
jgi:putative ABC transport system permease protein